jgi:NADH-quinone oxidoreductase subunit A
MTPTSADLQPYAAIGVTIAAVATIVAAMLILAHTIGPRRHGPVKDSPYESGMPVLNDARRRYHIRFYIVAVLFMLFDVEVVFLWPWAVVFRQSAAEATTFALNDGTIAGKGFLLGGMAVFFLLLLFGLVYEWKKGAFEWD